MHKVGKRLILLELNEINFDVAAKYVNENVARFSSLKKLLSCPCIRTKCEKRYDELEPWIQWVSVHTAKTYSEHGVYRLGDMVENNMPQIFERIEQGGYAVGAISAMNAVNRLIRPAYFIPDPWTQTPSDRSWWSRALAQAVSQVVNDNAQMRITIKSALFLGLCFVHFANPVHYLKYVQLIFTSAFRPWRRAQILDLLLHDVHWKLFDVKKPGFSTLFLNAGAHIQHHYFLNSPKVQKHGSSVNPTWYIAEDADPLGEVLKLYDLIIGEYLDRTDTEIVVATGLSQKPCQCAEFYYRLKNHADFLRALDIRFSRVFPRMTRDFLIDFDNEDMALKAECILSSIHVGELPLFGMIDNRGKSLFVTLTYPNEIDVKTRYKHCGRTWPLLPEVSFVAIKNGIHQEDGYAFFTPEAASKAPADGAHVARIGESILRYFDITDPPTEARSPN